MRITIGDYKGLTAQELVDRDPGYAEWFWQHAEGMPMELRQEVRVVLAETRLARLSDQYDRLSQKMDAMKRQHARPDPGAVRRRDQRREGQGGRASTGSG